jgi:hypothetical protein
MERREPEGAVTLAALSRAAKALDAELVYAIVPRRTLAAMREDQALAVAAGAEARAAHSMQLEAQDVDALDRHRLLRERAEALQRSWTRRLWDRPTGPR